MAVKSVNVELFSPEGEFIPPWDYGYIYDKLKDMRIEMREDATPAYVNEVIVASHSHQTDLREFIRQVGRAKALLAVSLSNKEALYAVYRDQKLALDSEVKSGANIADRMAKINVSLEPLLSQIEVLKLYTNIAKEQGLVLKSYETQFKAVDANISKQVRVLEIEVNFLGKSGGYDPHMRHMSAAVSDNATRLPSGQVDVEVDVDIEEPLLNDDVQEIEPGSYGIAPIEQDEFDVVGTIETAEIPMDESLEDAEGIDLEEVVESADPVEFEESEGVDLDIDIEDGAFEAASAGAEDFAVEAAPNDQPVAAASEFDDELGDDLSDISFYDDNDGLAVGGVDDELDLDSQPIGLDDTNDQETYDATSLVEENSEIDVDSADKNSTLSDAVDPIEEAAALMDLPFEDTSAADVDAMVAAFDDGVELEERFVDFSDDEGEINPLEGLDSAFDLDDHGDASLQGESDLEEATPAIFVGDNKDTGAKNEENTTLSETDDFVDFDDASGPVLGGNAAVESDDSGFDFSEFEEPTATAIVGRSKTDNVKKDAAPINEPAPADDYDILSEFDSI